MNGVLVRKAFFAAYNANATLKTLVPGGLWEKGQVQQAAATPYGYITALEQEILETSKVQLYTQEVQITLCVYSTAGPIDAGNINDAIDLVFDWRQKDLQKFFPSTVICLAVQPTPDVLETDPVRKNATDVEVLMASWLVNLQVTRAK